MLRLLSFTANVFLQWPALDCGPSRNKRHVEGSQTAVPCMPRHLATTHLRRVCGELLEILVIISNMSLTRVFNPMTPVKHGALVLAVVTCLYSSALPILGS